MVHVEPCGCQYGQVDVPDDRGYGQGWERVAACSAHAATCRAQFHDDDGVPYPWICTLDSGHVGPHEAGTGPGRPPARTWSPVTIDVRPKPAFWDGVVARHPRKAAMRLVRLERLAAAGQLVPESTAVGPDTLAGLRDALDRAVRCRRCGRRLEDPESVVRRVGPECKTKEGGR